MRLNGKEVTDEHLRMVFLAVMQQANLDTFDDKFNTPEDCNKGDFIIDYRLPTTLSEEATYFSRSILSMIGLCAIDGRGLEIKEEERSGFR